METELKLFAIHVTHYVIKMARGYEISHAAAVLAAPNYTIGSGQVCLAEL